MATLFEAAKVADDERVKFLLDSGADANVSIYGETPLHVVGVHEEHHDCYAYTECVRLLRQHIDFNINFKLTKDLRLLILLGYFL